MWNNADKFDNLISLAALKCTEEEARKLNELDTSEVEFDESYYRKRDKTIKKYKNAPKKSKFKTVAVRIAVASAIIVAVLVLMVGCIPGVRQAIYNAIVEWYEDCFTVRYEGSSIPEKETEEKENGAPPTYIKETRKPTYHPEGIWEDVLINTNHEISIDYYIGEEYLFSFSQTLLDSDEVYIDNEGVKITQIKIRGNDATLVDIETKNSILILWNDNECAYKLITEAIEAEELIKYANSVE